MSRRLREYTLKRRYKTLKKCAEKHAEKLEFTLTEYTELVKDGKCFYCTGPLEPTTGHSVDRIDSKKGYVKGNSVPCCRNCNLVKSNLLTATEMLYIVFKLKDIRGLKPEQALWPRRVQNGIQKRKRKR